MSLGVLVIILILVLLGVIPTWGQALLGATSQGWREAVPG
jgi:hypothetical protein